MPKPKVPVAKREITRWSYSSWSTYDECGLRFDYKYLQKLPEPGPPNFAMARGTDIHTKAEYWLTGKISGPLPKPLQKMKHEFEGLKSAQPSVETWWGVDRNWQPIKYNSWVVAKTDAYVEHDKSLTVIDFKTGKQYSDKHEKQASLYAVLGQRHFPKVKEVTTEFWYLDQGKTLTWTWSQDQLEGWRALWHERGMAVMTHKDLRPKPGWYCSFCPYSKENGGPCPVK